MYGNIIKDRREELFITQSELAEKMGFNAHMKSAICQWENEKHKPSIKSARKLASVLGGQPYEYRLETESKNKTGI